MMTRPTRPFDLSSRVLDRSQILTRPGQNGKLNSQKWPSDSSKGSGTPTIWPSHSVKLFSLLPNHSFSNLGFSGLGQQKFLKFDLVVSKWPKFNNWLTFSKNITDLIHLRPHQTLCYFVAFWVVLTSTTWQTFGGPSQRCQSLINLNVIA